MSTTVKSAPIPPSRQREKPGQPLKWIGKNIKRVEDPRLLTGQGRYIDDIDLPNMLHAAVLRSPTVPRRRRPGRLTGRPRRTACRRVLQSWRRRWCPLMDARVGPRPVRAATWRTRRNGSAPSPG